jgi:hypothetical protein
MDVNYNRFQDRLRRIEGTGSGVSVRPDGLVVPRRARRLRLGFPWRSLMLAVTCCFLLKGLMIWHQGEPAYAARLAELAAEEGTGPRVAVWVLSMDPVSLWLGRGLTDLLGRPPA